MSVSTRLRSALAALLLALIAVLFGPLAPRAEAASCSGVWVVVESSVRCASSYSTGLDALRSAGYSVATVGTGFVCRIDGSPSTCTTNVPYWSYWHATRNADGTWGDWQYSSRGASAYSPEAGSAEGWSFGDASPPSGTPPVSATSTTTRQTTTTTTTEPASTTTTRATSTTSTTQPAGGTSTQPAGTTSRPAGGTPGAAGPGGSSVTPVPGASTPGATTVTAGASATASGSASASVEPHASATGFPTASAGGPPVAVLATGGVLLLGGAGLGAMTWRARRR